MYKKIIDEMLKIAEEQGYIDRFLNLFRKKHRVLILG